MAIPVEEGGTAPAPISPALAAAAKTATTAWHPEPKPEWLGDDPVVGSVYRNPDGSYWSASTGSVWEDPRQPGVDEAYFQQQPTAPKVDPASGAIRDPGTWQWQDPKSQATWVDNLPGGSAWLRRSPDGGLEKYDSATDTFSPFDPVQYQQGQQFATAQDASYFGAQPGQGFENVDDLTLRRMWQDAQAQDPLGERTAQLYDEVQKRRQATEHTFGWEAPLQRAGEVFAQRPWESVIPPSVTENLPNPWYFPLRGTVEGVTSPIGLATLPFGGGAGASLAGNVGRNVAGAALGTAAAGAADEYLPANMPGRDIATIAAGLAGGVAGWELAGRFRGANAAAMAADDAVSAARTEARAAADELGIPESLVSMPETQRPTPSFTSPYGDLYAKAPLPDTYPRVFARGGDLVDVTNPYSVMSTADLEASIRQRFGSSPALDFTPPAPSRALSPKENATATGIISPEKFTIAQRWAANMDNIPPNEATLSQMRTGLYNAGMESTSRQPGKIRRLYTEADDRGIKLPQDQPPADMPDALDIAGRGMPQRAPSPVAEQAIEAPPQSVEDLARALGMQEGGFTQGAVKTGDVLEDAAGGRWRAVENSKGNKEARVKVVSEDTGAAATIRRGDLSTVVEPRPGIVPEHSGLPTADLPPEAAARADAIADALSSDPVLARNVEERLITGNGTPALREGYVRHLDNSIRTLATDPEQAATRLMDEVEAGGVIAGLVGKQPAATKIGRATGAAASRTAYEAAALSRGMTGLMGDMGFILRNGGMRSLNPFYTRDTVQAMREILSDPGAIKAAQEARDARLITPLRRAVGGVWHAADGNDPLHIREETMASSWLRKAITVKGHNVNPIAHVELRNNAFLDFVRNDSFDNIMGPAFTKWREETRAIFNKQIREATAAKDTKRAAELLKQGKAELELRAATLPETQALVRQAQGVYNVILHGTGRGTGSFLDKLSTLPIGPLLAPKWLASRPQAILDMFNPILLKENPLAWREAVKNNVGFFSTVAGGLAILDFAGMDVEWDPRSANFGAFKLPGTHVWNDFTGGYRPIIHFMANLITQENKSERTGNIYDRSVKDSLGYFTRARLTPGAGAVMDYFAPQYDPTKFGNQTGPFAQIPYVGGIIDRTMYPLILKDVQAIWNSSQPWWMKPGETLSSFLGAGAQVHEDAYTARDDWLNENQDTFRPYLLDGETVVKFSNLNARGRQLAEQQSPQGKVVSPNAAAKRVEANKAREETAARQRDLDDGLRLTLENNPGGTSVDRWKIEKNKLRSELMGRLREIYPPGDFKPDMRDPIERYFDFADHGAMRNGLTDWDVVDQWLASQSSADRAAIEEYLKNLPRNDTEPVKEFRAVGDKLRETGYFDLKDKLWADKGYARATGFDSYWDYKDSWIAKTAAAIQKQVPTMDATMARQEAEKQFNKDARIGGNVRAKDFEDNVWRPAFETWVLANPDTAKAANKWEYITLNTDLRAAVQGDTTAIKAAQNKRAVETKLNEAGWQAVDPAIWKSFAGSNPALAKYETYEDYRDALKAALTEQQVAAAKAAGIDPARVRETIKDNVAKQMSTGALGKVVSDWGKKKEAERTAWIKLHPQLAFDAYQANLIELTADQKKMLGLPK